MAYLLTHGKVPQGNYDAYTYHWSILGIFIFFLHELRHMILRKEFLIFYIKNPRNVCDIKTSLNDDIIQ